jgi:hypothetical protein
MGHTRDDSQALGLGTSDPAGSVLAAPAPYVGKRRASVAAPVTTPAAPYVGKRRATPVEPAPAPARVQHDTAEIARVLAELEPVDQTTSFAGEDTVVLPLQPATTAASASPSPAGRRRAAKPVRSLGGGLLAKAPSAPVLVGVAVMAVSVAGVLTTQSPDPVSSGTSRIGSIGALSGSDAIGAVRPGVVSRSSDRDALADASGMALEEQVEMQAEQRDAALAQLADQAEKRAGVLADNRWVLPVAGYRLTATFGEYGLWSSYHTGLDFAADPGTPIMAVARGVITSTGYDGAYGNKTVLTLEDGTEIWFCHQTSIYASVGDVVAPGDVIGTVGSTGHVTGPHLHLEVRPGGGDPVDPYAALVVQGLQP